MSDDRAPSIADLIRRHQDRTGDSLGQIAKITGVSKSALGDMATSRSRRVLQERTIERLATGLRLPVAVVHDAALVSAGMMPAGPGADKRIQMIITDLERLSADDLETVETFVSALVKRRG